MPTLSVAAGSLEELVTGYLYGTDDDLLADPYPLYARLREEAPVYFHRPSAQVLVSRYVDVEKVSVDGESFSREVATGTAAAEHRRAVDASDRAKLEELIEWEAGFMSRKEGAAHRRLRDRGARWFTKRSVLTHEHRIQQIVDTLLDAAAEREETDAVADFAYQVPLILICEMLEFPIADVPKIRAWTSELGRFVNAQRTNIARAHAALGEFREYVRSLVFASDRAVGESLLQDLVKGGERADRLAEDEAFATVSLFLFAGHDTTTNVIANGVLALQRHRAQWELLSREPELVTNAVEEILRYDPPVQVDRIACTEGDIAGVSIPPGQTIDVLLGSANRDPDEFDDPDTFDIRRAEARRNLAFGVGRHHCIGNQLARLEARIAIGTMVRRFPRMTLACEPDEVSWRATPFNRGPKALRVRLIR